MEKLKKVVERELQENPSNYIYKNMCSSYFLSTYILWYGKKKMALKFRYASETA